MKLKFCVNLNKILEVIRFFVMTVVLCHPVARFALLCKITQSKEFIDITLLLRFVKKFF